MNITTDMLWQTEMCLTSQHISSHLTCTDQKQQRYFLCALPMPLGQSVAVFTGCPMQVSGYVIFQTMPETTTHAILWSVQENLLACGI